MSRARAAVAPWLLAVAATSGCSVLEPEPGTDADFAGREAEVYCGKTFECCGELVDGQSLSQCETVSKFSLLSDGKELQEAIDRGTARYDADAAARCLETLAAESCETWALFVERRGPDVCNGLVTGLLGAGEPCQSHFECAGGSCMVDGEGGARKCRLLARLGEPCTEPEIRYCEPPLACRQGAEGVSTCVELGSEGAACERDTDCHAGLCVDERCTVSCNRRT